MMNADPHPNGGSSHVNEMSSSGSELDGQVRELNARWHPGVRLTLILVVSLPILATGIFTASGVTSGWAFRQHAQVVATRADQLQTVADARAEMNPLQVPLLAVSYAAQLGISESELDALLKPAVPFRIQLEQGTKKIAGFSTLSSTPTLRGDVVKLRVIIPQVEANTISFGDARAFMVKMAADIDDVWYRDYNHLLADISTWQAPGSFGVHAAAMRQAYQGFLAGGHEIEGALYVLEGTGPKNAKQELIQAAGEFGVATTEFAGHLGPKAQAAWRALQRNSADHQFNATIQQGLQVALNGSPPPFAGNTTFAGSSLAPGLQYLADLNKLVTAASQDLHDSALAQASGATHRFINEIVFLFALVLISVGGVIIAARVLTRPLKRLATTAWQGTQRRLRRGAIA